MRYLLWLALLAWGATASVPARSAPTIKIDSGPVTGLTQSGLTVFKGIPYAAPPLANLRWKPPQPVPPWARPRQATEFRPACMQTGVSMPGETPPAISEDCLYLNIWTKPAPPKAHLPVMVFIHGGGFTNGSAAMPLYWGDRLAQRGVIVVTFGYRLGPFGFLALPALTAESPQRTSGNYALLDQIAALRWVHRNIAAFGGDPGRVTLFGQSAGAMSISALMAMPAAKGLFQRAIAESGGIFEPAALAPGWQLPNAEKDGTAYAASLGAPTLAALRRLPAASFLTQAATAISHPVLDGAVLPQPPYDSFAAGHQNDVPLLLGSNEDEARSLIDLTAVKAATFDADIAKAWGQLPPPLLAAYPHATDAQAKTARAGFERDLRFGWDMWEWARLQATTGHQPVYYYHFTHRPPFPPGSIEAGWGASHFAELWYVFDHLNQQPWPWTPQDRQLAATMAAYWTNFAKTGDPNGPVLPPWPRFKPGTNTVQYLDIPPKPGPVADQSTLTVFDAVYAGAR